MKPIEKLSEKDFAAVFHDLREKVLEDPIKYFVEAEGFIDFTPTAAQRVAMKIVFGQQLDDNIRFPVNFEDSSNDTFRLTTIQMSEVEIYEYMTGKTYIPGVEAEITDVDLIIGRRGGKSTIASILALFGVIKENWKPMLHKTPHATVLILSHTKEFSQEILEILRDMVYASPILSRLLNKKRKNTQYTFNMQVPFLTEVKGEKTIEYSKVQVAVGAASKKTVRGKAICFSLNDEIAYWGTDEKYAETDEDIIRAIRPSLGQFQGKGMMIKLSSPGLKQGILYEEYQNREDLPDSFVVFKAPSWYWNNIVQAKFFETEYKLDPNGFASEYRADFVDSLSDFIMTDMVDACVIRGSTIRPPEAKGEDVTYVAAIDAAFKGDRFTFSITGYHEGRFKQYVMMSWEGSRSKPVSAHNIAKFIRNVAKDYSISAVHADQYAFQPLKEIFEQYNLVLNETPFTNKFKKQIYYNLKTLIHNQKIDLLDNAQCIKEIKQLQVEQTSTGTVRIGHPPGGHDDCADVVAICSYLLAFGLHRAGIDVGEVAGIDYGIKTDRNGKPIGQAPSAEMLSEVYEYSIFDNSELWTRHPETKKWVKRSELEEEENLEAGKDLGGDFIFA